jgi:hypothetical protein
MRACGVSSLSPGDLVVTMVRRPRTRPERVVDEARYMVAVPRALREVGTPPADTGRAGSSR